MGCVQSYVQSLFPGPREAQLACLAAPATNPSPTLSMAGSGYLGQSSQGPRLPQAFQELGSEVTDCPGQGGEQCSDRNFPFGVLDRESGTCAWSGQKKSSWFCRTYEESELWPRSSWWGNLWLSEDEDLWKQAILA